MKNWLLKNISSAKGVEETYFLRKNSRLVSPVKVIPAQNLTPDNIQGFSKSDFQRIKSIFNYTEKKQTRFPGLTDPAEFLRQTFYLGNFIVADKQLDSAPYSVWGYNAFRYHPDLCTLEIEKNYAVNYAPMFDRFLPHLPRYKGVGVITTTLALQYYFNFYPDRPDEAIALTLNSTPEATDHYLHYGFEPFSSHQRPSSLINDNEMYLSVGRGREFLRITKMGSS